MKKNISGSIDESVREADSILSLLDNLKNDKPPWGLLIFEQDGSVSSLCASEEIIGEENTAHIMTAIDFAHYAFDRPDWMMEYIAHTRSLKREQSMTGPQLELIKGGLDDEA